MFGYTKIAANEVQLRKIQMNAERTKRKLADLKELVASMNSLRMKISLIDYMRIPLHEKNKIKSKK